MTDEKAMSLRLPLDLAERLEEVAKRDDLSQAQVIRKALRHFLSVPYEDEETRQRESGAYEKTR